MGSLTLTLLLATGFLAAIQVPSAGALAPTRAGAYKVAEVSEVGLGWSGHPTKYLLQSRGKDQYVAFYDANRDMTLAKRTQGADGAWGPWQVQKVPGEQPSPWGEKATKTRIGWDSHNYIAMEFDGENNLHLSGNLHNNPLLYFRTETPGDLTTLRRIDRMTGVDESRTTYPKFLVRSDGELVFNYRQGMSGNGKTLYNIYDTKTKTWRRLLDKPLHDGAAIKGVRSQTCNAYAVGPTLGPDGYYHVAWVWRNTGDCETNHSVSYARSKDLVSWEESAGTPTKLPITPETSEIVDPVPVNGGVINNNTLIGFDADKRVVLTYHKFDAAGHTQIYNARREDGRWVIRPVTKWTFRWDFRGQGSMTFEVRPSPVEVLPDGRLVQTWWSKTTGGGGAVLDPRTLEPIGPYAAPDDIPAELRKRESAHPKMEVQIVEDTGDASAIGGKGRWVLRYETHRLNNDQPLKGAIPEPSPVRVYRVVEE